MSQKKSYESILDQVIEVLLYEFKSSAVQLKSQLIKDGNQLANMPKSRITWIARLDQYSQKYQHNTMVAFKEIFKKPLEQLLSTFELFGKELEEDITFHKQQDYEKKTVGRNCPREAVDKPEEKRGVQVKIQKNDFNIEDIKEMKVSDLRLWS